MGLIYSLQPYPLIKQAEVEVCSRGFPVVGPHTHSRRCIPVNSKFPVAMHSGRSDILVKLSQAFDATQKNTNPY